MGQVPTQAADFSGQRIMVVIGNDVGGGTDVAGRLLVPFFEQYLPGKPTVLVRNMQVPEALPPSISCISRPSATG